MTRNVQKVVGTSTNSQNHGNEAMQLYVYTACKPLGGTIGQVMATSNSNIDYVDGYEALYCDSEKEQSLMLQYKSI